MDIFKNNLKIDLMKLNKGIISGNPIYRCLKLFNYILKDYNLNSLSGLLISQVELNSHLVLNINFHFSNIKNSKNFLS